VTKEAQNITIYAGDTADINVTVYAGETTTRKNIANSTINWVVFDPDSTGVILTKTTGDAITITDGLNGLFTISLVPADTEDIPPATYRHEAEITDSSGNVSTVTVGDFIVKESRA
jgi:hypothetical protein